MARQISIADFTYELPNEKIASYPLQERDQSKLLYYHSGNIQDHIFTELPDYLPEKSLLVFNKTKVVFARILLPLPDKVKKIEIFILEPAYKMATEEAMQKKGKATWICLVGNNKHFKNNSVVKTFHIGKQEYILTIKKPKKTADAFEIDFEWDPALSFSEVLAAAGTIPLPPYLNRETREDDKSRYQTIYAKEEGSVAAPTAGLHFTDRVMNELKNKNHSFAELILHVGAGTFRPVKSETMEDHQMHKEEIIVSLETLELLSANSANIIAVGTTSLRTMESLFWLGLKLLSDSSPDELRIEQWDAYDLPIPNGFDFKKAIETLIDYLKKNNQTAIKAKTRLLIAPGYSIKSAKGLITNFHQPKSTLLLLVAALIGDDWKKVYNHALKNNYRFLSFGDSSLLLK